MPQPNNNLDGSELARLRVALLENSQLHSRFEEWAYGKTFKDLWDTDETYAKEIGDLLYWSGLVNFESGRYTPVRRLNLLAWAVDEPPLLITTDFAAHAEDAGRVFPWVDEAEAVLNYLDSRPGRRPERILDMCCGAGGIALALAKRYPDATVVGVDVSEQAIERAEFNAALNAVPNVTFRVGNLWEPVGDEQFDLITANPPFSIEPPAPPMRYVHSEGGESGVAVVAPFLEGLGSRLPSPRVVLLSYTLGNLTQPLLLLRLVEEKCGSRYFCFPTNLKERMWRYRDEKLFTSPMPVEYAIIRLGDATYGNGERLTMEQSKALADQYSEWINSMRTSSPDTGELGYSHLWYLVMDFWPKATTPAD